MNYVNKPETIEQPYLNRKYPLLDLTHYIASLFVILIHCGRLTENEFIHFTLKVFFGRLAVPLFLITAGYFFYLKQQANPAYPHSYFKRQWKVYLFWSFVYLPYGIWFVKHLSLDPKLYLAALPVGFGYLGFCYHLWYFPALFFGLYLVRKLLRHFSFPVVFGICFLLFTIGAIETYSGYLEGTKIQAIYAMYQHFFFTTRNGLFYTPIFLLIGFYLAVKKPFSKKFRCLGLGFSVLCLAFESVLVCLKQGADKNFLFSLIPVSLFLMELLLRSTNFANREFSHLRKTAQFLYFMHPLFLESSKGLFHHFGFGELQGIPLFVCSYVLTFLSLKLVAVAKTGRIERTGSKVFNDRLQEKQEG